mmetsp:Transcript_53934/g.167151  ORF Transcript_53934/g.167151 Transcript_53934/m.167151 type:complete len:320 (-) Transcript_53934:128-1087(-)|eukprot:CAMPEP_0204582348 /NCGR_PEP_ID=MMETSP0661-20131031/45167_1 /ASSEMBLY_ACC=CAM_ASM_000606 /TAXON_ID=109239 /ORGANISM="Alexandrium margalefi, Strain AMGDE01CS-322" /LENGTH=319 /DNA_ID=CAMNT_0051591619 /DNA_START=145 /DNA_END=1104 /DNA_ORIENTATION=+
MFADQQSMDKQDGMGAPIYGLPSYGNAPTMASKTPLHRHKRHVGISVLLLCLSIPVGIYAAVCAVMSFQIHHTSPGVTWLVVILAAAATAAVGALAATAARRRYVYGDFNREPYWYIFLTLTMMAAWIFAVCLGHVNFNNNMLPYEDLQNLSAHPAVDPATMTSREVMDVGRVMFTEGAQLDLTKSIGFKNTDRYCVAPITMKGTSMTNYYFWAIGLNCCSGNAADFHCGEYDNSKARGGLRLMREDQRAFYRLAVQQAEATFNIKADYPLFFYWMQSPSAEMESYRDDAMKFYLLGLCTAFFCQLLLLVLAVLGHSKL